MPPAGRPPDSAHVPEDTADNPFLGGMLNLEILQLATFEHGHARLQTFRADNDLLFVTAFFPSECEHKIKSFHHLDIISILL